MDVIEANADMFKFFIDGESFESYVRRLRMPLTWGSELEIAAFAQAFNCQVEIFTQNGLLTTHSPNFGNQMANANNTYNYDNAENMSKPPKLIRLCFLYGNHYDSVHDKEFIKSCGVCQKIFYDIFDSCIKLPNESTTSQQNSTVTTYFPTKKDTEYTDVEYEV